ncbi:hypothetical protein ACGF4C_33725 [Streptomyces sp. NPDC048197]|uniref:hypothetical protein n=1 Tax=Streptomyces sp. NPDC048197 TaxID=3365511 RepID=UPI0037201BB7
MDRTDRATATVLGSAVGDALGAPFEFGEPGAYTGTVQQATPTPPHRPAFG